MSSKGYVYYVYMSLKRVNNVNNWLKFEINVVFKDDHIPRTTSHWVALEFHSDHGQKFRVKNWKLVKAMMGLKKTGTTPLQTPRHHQCYIIVKKQKSNHQ